MQVPPFKEHGGEVLANAERMPHGYYFLSHVLATVLSPRSKLVLLQLTDLQYLIKSWLKLGSINERLKSSGGSCYSEHNLESLKTFFV
jgi:hypothetical protein